MQWKTLLLALGLSPLTGCLLARNTARNVFNEPAELYDNKKVCRQLRRDAKAVWTDICRSYPQRTFTSDFVDGFTDGYVDHLDSGGTAQPPAVPPLKYRRSRYMSVEGHASIRDYFCGFKYGCEVAAGSGQRDLITVPILLSETPVEAPVQARQVPTGPVRAMPPAYEPLPPPKATDAGTGLPLLDRPLLDRPEGFTPRLPPGMPAVPIPEIEPPPFKSEGPLKFAAPSDIRSGMPPRPAPTEAVPDARVVPPLREFPNAAPKPVRTLPEGRPVPPWRGD